MSDLERIFESGLPLATAVLALIPLVILLVTYRRTKSTRILLASLAFATFVVKGIVLSLGFFLAGMSFELLELTEFTTDFVAVLLFTVSFLWSFRKTSE